MRKVRAHRPDRGHRPDADLRPTASADHPGPVRGPLQRAAAPSQPSALPAPARSSSCRLLPGSDPAPARSRRPHQRVPASRIEALVRMSGRVLKPHRQTQSPDATSPRTSSWPSSKASDYADLPARNQAATRHSRREVGITRRSA